MVICTIHQPQNKIFNLFDNLILMKHGEIIYNGIASKAIEIIIPLKYNSQITNDIESHYHDNVNYGDILINEISDERAKATCQIKC